MPMYKVFYTLMGSGILEIEAENEEQAEELAFDFTTEKLIEESDFKRGFSITEIVESED